MLDEMSKQNASKFAIFYIYENPKLLLTFFISCYFIFFPNECPGLCRLVWDISRWEMGKGKNVGGKFPVGKRHWENGKNIPPKYRQFWDLN